MVCDGVCVMVCVMVCDGVCVCVCVCVCVRGGRLSCVSAWCTHVADTTRLLVVCVCPMADAASPLGRAPSPEPAPPRLQKLVKIDNPRLAHAQFSQDMELLASATDDYRALYVWRSFHAVGGGALVVA